MSFFFPFEFCLLGTNPVLCFLIESMRCTRKYEDNDNIQEVLTLRRSAKPKCLNYPLLMNLVFQIHNIMKCTSVGCLVNSTGYAWGAVVEEGTKYSA